MNEVKGIEFNTSCTCSSLSQGSSNDRRPPAIPTPGHSRESQHHPPIPRPIRFSRPMGGATPSRTAPVSTRQSGTQDQLSFRTLVSIIQPALTIELTVSFSSKKYKGPKTCSWNSLTEDLGHSGHLANHVLGSSSHRHREIEMQIEQIPWSGSFQCLPNL